MKKRVLAVLLTGVLAAGILTGCGGAAEDAAADAQVAEETPAEEETRRQRLRKAKRQAGRQKKKEPSPSRHLPHPMRRFWKRQSRF